MGSVSSCLQFLLDSHAASQAVLPLDAPLATLCPEMCFPAWRQIQKYWSSHADHPVQCRNRTAPGWE